MNQKALSSELTYRLHREEDIPGLLRLWEENTEWGSLTPEQWRKWYIDTPHGPCLIPVAVDETGTIRGQLAFTPARLAFEDQELKVLRMSAPILERQLRSVPKEHPIACLHKLGMSAARKQGYSLAYAYPDRSLKNFLHKYDPHMRLDMLGCASLPVPPRFSRSAGLRVNPVISFGNEYKDLWHESRRNFPLPLAIVRGPEWLVYRHSDRLALEVRTAARKLVGYAVLDARTGLLTDCLARTRTELADVLRACIAWLADGSTAVTEIKAMMTPMMRPIFSDLGFVENDFKFLLACSVADPQLPMQRFALNTWHFMPGD